MATHFRILAWKIPWTEEPGGVQSMESYIPWSHKELGMTEQMSKFINLSATSNFLSRLYIPSIHFIHCIFPFQNFHLACFGVYTHTHTILGAVSTANSFWFSFLLSSWTDTYKVSWKDFFLLISTCGSTWGQLLLNDCYYYFGLPWWIRRKRICLQYRRPSFDLWKIPWRRKWLPTPVSLLW